MSGDGGGCGGGGGRAALVVEWLRPSKQTSLQRQEQMKSLQMPFKTRAQQLSPRKGTIRI